MGWTDMEGTRGSGSFRNRMQEGKTQPQSLQLIIWLPGSPGSYSIPNNRNENSVIHLSPRCISNAKLNPSSEISDQID